MHNGLHNRDTSEPSISVNFGFDSLRVRISFAVTLLLFTMDDTDLQRRIAEAAKTKTLDLSSMRLTYSLPPGINSIKYLRSITLYKNLLETIPQELFRFVLLEELNLFRNKLHAIPTNLSSLAHLKILNLGSNQLETLPPQLFTLSQLEELDLSNNGISILPADIKNLTRLRDLALFRNKFKALPGELANLRQLKKLDVSQNQIVNMPSTLGELKLQTLSASDTSSKERAKTFRPPWHSSNPQKLPPMFTFTPETLTLTFYLVSANLLTQRIRTQTSNNSRRRR